MSVVVSINVKYLFCGDPYSFSKHIILESYDNTVFSSLNNLHSAASSSNETDAHNSSLSHVPRQW
jgi:hypothetical protein